MFWETCVLPRELQFFCGFANDCPRGSFLLVCQRLTWHVQLVVKRLAKLQLRQQYPLADKSRSKNKKQWVCTRRDMLFKKTEAWRTIPSLVVPYLQAFDAANV